MLNNHQDYETIADASNGQEAIDIINSKPDQYDVLVTDISMPLLTGVELCRMVKSEHPHIKVIILSMYSSPAMVKESVAAEADAYVLKNAGKEVLLSALYKVCNDGTYYSEEIIPLIFSQIEKEKEIKENTQILSERERDVLQLILKENTSEEIAKILHISKKTVDNHRSNILHKTNSKSTIGLVKYALKNGFK
jgi:DNA-binding NarL/FixJ family response regulator